MRAKEIIDQKEIERCEISIKKMIELSEVNKNSVFNFISFVNDEGDFVIKTRYPIPSCRCSDVKMEEYKGSMVPVFYYNVYFKGSFEKEFTDFLVNGKQENYSFYGNVYDLVIFKEKPNKREDTFQVSFNSVTEFYEKLHIQRNCDLKYRISILDRERYNIYDKISKYKEMEEVKKNFLQEIKANKKEDTIYYRSIDETVSYAKANIMYRNLSFKVKSLRKSLPYPKFINFNELSLSIAQNKIKVVSFTTNEKGEYIFYYYK